MNSRLKLASSSSTTSLPASLCVLVLTLVWSETSVAQSDDPAVDISWGQKIAMRDGVKLNATVYKPRSMPAPLPVIFTLTPYISDTYHDRAWFFSQNEYVFVLVDARGRGNSEGKFVPFLQEAKDGHDIVQWLARQSWCDGQVAMWGGSYAGYDQWATAKEFPPNLVTIVPAAAAFPGVDFPMRRNIPYQYDIQWATLTSGVTPNMNLFQQREYWAQVYSRMYDEHLPFKDLPGLAGNLTTDFATWVSHPNQDEFWDAMNPTDDEFAGMNLPILTITGHYDGDQLGAMEFYKRHMQFASDEAKQKHFLIMGPWDHAGTRTPGRETGGLDLGEASMLDLNQLHKEWYDWTMKDGEKPEFLKQRIASYVTGSDQWEYSSSLNSIAPNTRTLYLSSTDGKAQDVFRSGLLSDEAPVADAAADRYVYDPLKNRPDNIDTFLENYITDQRDVLTLSGDGLVYHSLPFEEDTTVSGQLKLEVWMAIDVPDTDFQAKVYEIQSDGRSIALTDDLIRARYRDSSRRESLVKPGTINRYRFDQFSYFSRRIAKGSRLRLLITSPNSRYLQKNYNSGGVVAEESGDDARTARVTLYHDAEHPSSLQLPVSD